MNILIVYDSVFGNTEKIALAIGSAIVEGLSTGRVETLPVGRVAVSQLNGLDLLIVGSPTLGFRPTEEITKFFNSITKDQLAGMWFAAFDTRIMLATIDSLVLRFMVDKGGYAAKSIGKTMEKKGARLAVPPEGFYVTGEKGPLEEGELERAFERDRPAESVARHCADLVAPRRRADRHAEGRDRDEHCERHGDERRGRDQPAPRASRHRREVDFQGGTGSTKMLPRARVP